VNSIPQLEEELETLRRQNALDDEGTWPSAASAPGPPSAAPLLPAPAPPPPAPNVSLQDAPVDARAEPHAAARRHIAPTRAEPAAAARAHASTVSIVEPPASRPPMPAREPYDVDEEDKVKPEVVVNPPWKVTGMSYLFRGSWKGRGIVEDVVVKQWRQRQEQSDETENDLREELEFHRKLSHEYIMPLLGHGYFTATTTLSVNQVQHEYMPADSKVLWLIFPYYKNGDLAAYIDKLGKKKRRGSARGVQPSLHSSDVAWHLPCHGLRQGQVAPAPLPRHPPRLED